MLNQRFFVEELYEYSNVLEKHIPIYYVGDYLSESLFYGNSDDYFGYSNKKDCEQRVEKLNNSDLCLKFQTILDTAEKLNDPQKTIERLHLEKVFSNS